MSKVTTQQQVYDALFVNGGGGLWPEHEIKLHIAEELGELIKALRKGTKEQQEHELGDVGFALYCLAISTGMSLHNQVLAACERHKERADGRQDAGA